MRIHLTVKGRVQGVGYRFFVTQAAQRHAVTGWVRNCENGDVEAEAQGPGPALENFTQDLSGGHPWARVDHLRKEPIAERSGEKGFEIRY